jgi:hypothetical protein
MVEALVGDSSRNREAAAGVLVPAGLDDSQPSLQAALRARTSAWGLRALARAGVVGRSDSPRIGRLEAQLTRAGSPVLNVDGDTVSNVDLDAPVRTLSLSRRGEPAFQGRHAP